jgi:integrase
MASIKRYPDKNVGPKWRAVVRKIGFKARSKIFDLKTDAEAWAGDVEASMRQPTYRELAKAREHTVGEIFERFRNEVCPDRAGGKWESTRLNRLILDVEFTKRRLDQIRFEDVRDWRDQRLKEVSPATVNREMNLISGVFSHAIKEWSTPLPYNPVSLVSRPKGVARYRFRRWHQYELDAVIKAAEFDEAVLPQIGKDYVVWALLIACECAIRPKELCSLTVRDFHEADRYVHVHKTKNDAHKDTAGRHVPLNKRATELFKKLCQGKAADDKIVPIQEDTLGAYFRELRMKAGLKNADLRFYDSRHEGTTRLAKKLPNVLVLSAATGHKNLQSLKHYYNPLPSEIAAMLD